MNNKCVYIYINDTTHEPFYVGCGNLDRPKKLSTRSQKFMNIYNSNKCHFEIIKKNLSPEEAAELERQVIKDYREQGCELINQTNGGEMRQLSNWTNEMREEYAQRLKGENNPNYNHRWTNEQKEHLSKLRKKNGLSKGGNNPRARQVMCVETGVIYACKRDATEFLGVADASSSISFCLKDPKRVAGKGKYHFVGKELLEKLNTEEKRKKWLEEIAS